MKKIQTLVLPLIALAAVLTGCQSKMDIQGTTSVPELEGQMLYLRVYADGEMQDIDSTRIVHGKFHFTGKAQDSTIMAFLFMGDRSILPVVVEPQPLTITLSEAGNRVEGSPLNDTLFSFIQRKSLLDEQLAELPRRESQMILDGYDHDEILMQLNQEASVLSAQVDEMTMRFIKDNMDNVLAPGIFMVMTSNLPYPMLNPQIEELVTLGSPRFLNDAYVKEYLRVARENMEGE